jgi:hypothetical protein
MVVQSVCAFYSISALIGVCTKLMTKS